VLGESEVDLPLFRETIDADDADDFLFIRQSWEVLSCIRTESDAKLYLVEL